MSERRVSADSVLLAYCWAEVIRLLAEGHDRSDASNAGWSLLRQLVRAATGMTLPPPVEPVATPTTCLAESTAAVRDALSMPWPTFRAAHPEARSSTG